MEHQKIPAASCCPFPLAVIPSVPLTRVFCLPVCFVCLGSCCGCIGPSNGVLLSLTGVAPPNCGNLAIWAV